MNLHTYVSAPAVRGQGAVGGYSGSAVRPIALRFVAELGLNPELRGMHISGMGGIETWRDAAEFLLLGARSLQAATAVMQYGYRIIDDLKQGLNLYLAEKGGSPFRNHRHAGSGHRSLPPSSEGALRRLRTLCRLLRGRRSSGAASG